MVGHAPGRWAPPPFRASSSRRRSRSSTSSRSNRRCSRTVAPAETAVRRLRSPRMWEGGWPPGSGRRARGRGPRASGRWRDPWSVRVPHGLGQTGRARAEHQMASASSLTSSDRRRPPRPEEGGPVMSSRSVTRSSPMRLGEKRTASPSATAWTGAVSSSAWPTSVDLHAGLSRTAAAPSLLTAYTAMMNSARLVVISATRCPTPTPWAARCAAKASLRSSRSR